MAKAYYRYSCGCGFTTDDEEKALQHADEKNHILSVKGSVVPKNR